VSYGTPTTFRRAGLPAAALEGVDDVVIQDHLDNARFEIEGIIGRRYSVPIAPYGSPLGYGADLRGNEALIAAYRIISTFRGFPVDDPGYIAGRKGYEDAIAWAERVRDREADIVGLTEIPGVAVAGGVSRLVISANPARGL
jgi:phage gp36-like protein